MENKQFDFTKLSKEVFSNWKKFFHDNFVFTKLVNPSDISEPIVTAIKLKDIPKTDLSEITIPVLKKLEDIRYSIELKEGIEDVSVKNIEQARTDMTDVISVLKDILGKETQITVEPAKTDITVDISSIVKKLDELKKSIPKIEKTEIKDYSDVFSNIIQTIKDKKTYEIDYSNVLAEVKDLLYSIDNKKQKEYPFEFDDFGRVKVNVDRAGGGSSSEITDTLGNPVNPATEEKQDGIIAASDQLVKMTASVRNLLNLISNPGHLDKSNNALRILPIGGTITTVTGLSNIDGYQGKLLVINQNNSAWASVVRSRIS